MHSLKAELDITSLTQQLKELIEKHVNQSVSKAVNDLVENILDKTVQTAVDRLQTSNSVDMATFRLEMEVAVTSCALSSIIYNTGDIIKFSDVKLSNGIGNANNFKSSGKFTCEKPGLYLIGAYIVSYTKGSEFHIMKNGIMVSRVYVRPPLNSSDDNHHTGTGIIAVQLDVNDTLSIKASTTMQVQGGGYSCLTIIKEKMNL
ncbi:unnamed protein product [Mytilus edulis]|uniref:C1q domain-containing protein n=1 Tax=Mytilus edulis TaxID=6550 RepID=A0A8S3U2V7_MYTED|nr:unnamed protein product [Mytilus edulis]